MGGNGKPPQWEWELPALPWEFIPKVLCCDELIKLLVLYLPDANAYCAVCRLLKCNLFCPACGSVHSDNKWLGFLLLGIYYNYYRICKTLVLTEWEWEGMGIAHTGIPWEWE